MDTTLYIESTDVSPEIKFDLQQDLFVVKGRSMPENTEGFYQPVIDWLRANAIGLNRACNFDVALDYYNTGSFIRLMAIFNCLDELNKSGSQFTVRWICESDDEDNIEDGISFKQVVKVPFEVVKL
ncbi:MAG: hypothetical protein ACI9UR_000048 [Bacteroidia bacterium]|jgi:hypothetical protein